jgi:hypothetical protein
MTWGRLFPSTEQIGIANTVAFIQRERKRKNNRDTDHGGKSERNFATRYGHTWHGLLVEQVAPPTPVVALPLFLRSTTTNKLAGVTPRQAARGDRVLATWIIRPSRERTENRDRR